jgi:hypothetical protein
MMLGDSVGQYIILPSEVASTYETVEPNETLSYGLMLGVVSAIW